MGEIVTPRCPACDQPPSVALWSQYFCGTDDCRVFVWDPHADAAEFWATAKEIEIGPPEAD